MSNLAKVLIAALMVTMIGVVFLLYTQIATVERRAELRAKEDEARIQECSKEAEDLRTQIVQIKEQLAKALQAPEAMQLDPMHLAPGPPPGGVATPSEPLHPGGARGTIDQGKVIAVMQAGRGALQQCYERALKRNSALQLQQVRLTLGFVVQPSGKAAGVQVRPSYDSGLNDCIKSAVDRWKFPTPSGGSAAIEAPITLSPKGS